MKIFYLLASALCLSLLQGTQAGKSNEERLAADLLAGLGPVGKFVRPVPAAGGNVTVSTSMVLIRLASPSDRVFELDVWIKLFWNDTRLTWDPKDYGNVKSVALPYDAVWLPDLRPYKAMSYKPDKETASQVVVSSSGLVIYVLPASMATRCTGGRPYTCNVTLGSWVHSSKEIDLKLGDGEPFDLSEFQPDGVWKPVRAAAERKEKFYACCPESYVSIDYMLELKRMNSEEEERADVGA